jgi:hypothetical protein
MGNVLLLNTRGSQKVPGILWHRQFGVPWVRTAWTECCWSLLRSSFAEVARQVAGRDSGFCITITHRATHRLLCHHPATVPTGSPSMWLLGCSLLWKWDSRGHVSQPWRTSNRMQRRNSGRFQKKTSDVASSSGRIDGTSVCACAQGSCFEGG